MTARQVMGKYSVRMAVLMRALFSHYMDIHGTAEIDFVAQIIRLIWDWITKKKLKKPSHHGSICTGKGSLDLGNKNPHIPSCHVCSYLL